MTKSVSSPRSPGFLLAFALANAGGVLAYLPFLGLLLPLKVEAMAGADRVTVLSVVLAGGAVAAGAGNILVGLAIDRSVALGGGLRAWIAAGMVATAISFALVMAAHTPAALILAVIAFELALNVLIAPVAMVLVNEVPDAQKGLAGGLLTLGQPMAMLAGTGLVPLYEYSEAGAYGAIGLGICLLALPMVVTRARPVAQSTAPTAVEDLPGMARRDLTWLMLSRLLLLTANCILGVILIYYFENLLQGLTAGAVARRVGVVSMIAYVAAVPIAVVLGAKTVNRARRKAFAMGAALVAGGTVVMIVLAPRWEWAAIGYALFVCTIQVYTSQQSALVAQALRKPRHRARDLGYQNLANTVPAVIAPIIVVALYRYAAMPALIWTMAVLALASAIALSRVRVVRD